MDTQAPRTTIQVTSGLEWSRDNTPHFYPNATITLHATDDQNLTSITLNDTGVVTNFPTKGQSSEARLTITTLGVHTISYYSTDKAGNKESLHTTTIGLDKPNLSDLRNIIVSSNIDNAGIENALLAKVTSTEQQLATGQTPNALNALTNQLDTLEGKHGLDHGTVVLIESTISSITP